MFEFVIPYVCIICGKISERQQDLCLLCLNSLKIFSNSCPRCGQWLTDYSGNCGACLTLPPSFDATYVLFCYEKPLTDLILQLKFGESLHYARVMGELLAEKIREDWYAERDLPECIIPMPLHYKRLQERGFNQAVEIARPVAKKLKLPIDTASFVRKKPTLPQATLKKMERMENIKDAFALKKNPNCSYVAVLDDVMTTGQTIEELCRVIKLSGVRRIDVWCIARPV